VFRVCFGPTRLTHPALGSAVGPPSHAGGSAATSTAPPRTRAPTGARTAADFQDLGTKTTYMTGLGGLCDGPARTRL
jgi:hypothetical protein